MRSIISFAKKVMTTAIAAFLLAGCSRESDGENATNGVYPDCAQEQPKFGGDGAIENYAGFPSFNSSGITLVHTIGNMSYKTVSDSQLSALKKSIKGFSAFGTTYIKCNVEPGMHAKAVVDNREGEEYQLILSLYGNGGFVPNAAKFEEVFGIDAISDFYVWRNYNGDITARFNAYKQSAGCSDSPNVLSCGDTSVRWFQRMGSTTMSWRSL
jgi:hypothetical protein